MSAIYGLVAKMRAVLSEKLGALEEHFSKCSAKVDVAARVVDGRKTNVKISKLWRQVTTSLCAIIIFDGKHRVGVVQHLMVAEYLAAQRNEEGTFVIWVAKHKLGDKRPAIVVLDAATAEFVDRYYLLRRKVDNVAVDNFFVTNTGHEVNKIFDLLTTAIREKDFRYPDGDLVKVSGGWLRNQLETSAVDHGPAVAGQVAAALQHTEDTARRHYQMGSSTTAIRQHQAVVAVEQLKLMDEFICAE
ncbi:uncharacterized protein LOC112681120 [Sipha flava]|uniref:Uncharacterized protein LOC112681120 n=1 Tax=Sipha flava TaxID=143950 RepID=A0A8B8F9V8_9HEMI|nr:uncharacterized protein LOC112681120 [Sipha flava]XP_025407173.1 uncharacterized protein LOC112681120 [Sipha flava]